MAISTTPRNICQPTPMSPSRRPVSAAIAPSAVKHSARPSTNAPESASARAREVLVPADGRDDERHGRKHARARRGHHAAEEHEQEREQRRRRRRLVGKGLEQLLHQSRPTLREGGVELIGREDALVAQHLLALLVEHDLGRHHHDLESARHLRVLLNPEVVDLRLGSRGPPGGPGGWAAWRGRGCSARRRTRR